MYGSTSSLGAEVDADFETLAKRIEKNNDVLAYNVPQMTKLVTKIGTAQDSSELRANIQSILSSSRAILKENTQDLRRLRDSKLQASGASEADKVKRKALAEKLNAAFQIWSKKFQEVAEEYPTKERQYPINTNVSFNPFASSQEDDRAFGRSRGDTNTTTRGGYDPAQEPRLLDATEQAYTDYDEELIRHREKEVKEVHKSMVGLNQVMLDMSTLVHEQGDDIQSIDLHIKQAVEHSSKGVHELQKAEEHQQTGGRRTCCIIGFVAVIVVCVLLLLGIATNLI